LTENTNGTYDLMTNFVLMFCGCFCKKGDRFMHRTIALKLTENYFKV